MLLMEPMGMHGLDSIFLYDAKLQGKVLIG
jgi:hypothetical protein